MASSPLPPVPGTPRPSAAPRGRSVRARAGRCARVCTCAYMCTRAPGAVHHASSAACLTGAILFHADLREYYAKQCLAAGPGLGGCGMRGGERPPQVLKYFLCPARDCIWMPSLTSVLVRACTCCALSMHLACLPWGACERVCSVCVSGSVPRAVCLGERMCVIFIPVLPALFSCIVSVQPAHLTREIFLAKDLVYPWKNTY